MGARLYAYTIIAIVIASLHYFPAQFCLCPLSSLEEEWHRRPHTSAFLWKLQRISKDGKSAIAAKLLTFLIDYCELILLAIHGLSQPYELEAHKL
jgi:hypothetical protein